VIPTISGGAKNYLKKYIKNTRFFMSCFLSQKLPQKLQLEGHFAPAK
jgi:hypothetical protein